MPASNQTKWNTQYEDPRCHRKLLLCLPDGLQRDTRMLAALAEISVSEFVRRAITREIAEYLNQHPEHQVSFRGVLPQDASPASVPE